MLHCYKIIGTLFFLSLFLLTAHSGRAEKRPNIVIIVSDDHAFQAIGAYGGKFMPTPNIDRIAREGATFKRAYVTNSICGPSRAVLLTGKYSHKNKFRDNENSRFDGSQDSFAKQLQTAGYQTAWIGKWHLETQPQGFTYWKILPGQGHYYNPDFITMDGSTQRTEGYVSNIIADEAATWLNQRNPDKPFCLVIGHKATHRTWIPDTTDLGKFDHVNFPLPPNFYDQYRTREAARVQDMTIAKTMQMAYDLKMLSFSNKNEPTISRMNAAQRRKFDQYYLPIENDLRTRQLTGPALTEWKYQRYLRDYLSTAISLDRNIGRTLDYLDQHNLTRNTLVIYLSDQGFFLGEHGWFDKRFMYEESFRTPLVMRYPEVIKPGTVMNQLVLNLDIAPTLLQVAGVTVPPDMQGTSLLPWLKKPQLAGRPAIYYHYYENGEHAVSPHFGVKTDRYKLIRFYNRVNAWELYDLKQDPQEMRNLYNQPGYAPIIATLEKQLTALLRQYDDQEAMALMRQVIN